MRFAGSKNSLAIDPLIPPGGAETGAAQAAGLNTMPGYYNAAQQTSPRYDELAANAITNRSQERAAVTEAEAAVQAQGLASLGALRAAEIQGDASKDAAKSEATGNVIGSALSAAGTIGAALIMSDERTKTNIEQIDDGLALIRSLRPVSFNYNEKFPWANPNRKHHGFIAQEYETVLPDATITDIDGVKGIDITDCIAPLVRAVQQLETRVARMEAANALTGVSK